MTFQRDFLGLFPQTVTLYVFSGLSSDGYATRTYSTDTKSMRARVEQYRRLVRDINGREVVSQTTVFVPPYSTAGTSDTVVVKVSDKLILPSGFQSTGSTQPPIISVERVEDDAGHHHTEIYL